MDFKLIYFNYLLIKLVVPLGIKELFYDLPKYYFNDYKVNFWHSIASANQGLIGV